MTETQKALVELRPGRSAVICGRKVFGTYQGWHIYGRFSAEPMIYATSLPEAAAELEKGKPTDVS
jgi:hypothetical protein